MLTAISVKKSCFSLTFGHVKIKFPVSVDAELRCEL